jgi:hypothetical protein
MSTARPLFIVGNKRSGSTLLVNMLNEHPQICVTHESDVVWALFQAKESFPEVFECFELDAPRGLNSLLNAYGGQMRRSLGETRPSRNEIRAAFFDIQRLVIEAGTEMHAPLKAAEGLLWIGDKKPVQHASPRLRAFLADAFPDAKFVHIIRHPQSAVASQMSAARTWPVAPDFWKGASAEVLAQWCAIEDWVSDLKNACPDDVYTVRLEDLSSCPRSEMSALFGFLECSAGEDLLERLSGFVYAGVNAKHRGAHIPLSADSVRIMRRYNYE